MGPGDGSDLIDGGPGDDRLFFAGANVSERFTIIADGDDGFALFRDVGAVRMEVENTEVLEILTAGGADEVTTVALRNTAQHLKAGVDENADASSIDGDGVCLTREDDLFDVEGRPPIVLVGFAEVLVDDVFCHADPCDGAVATQGCTVNGVRDQLCQGTSGDDVILGGADADDLDGGIGDDRLRGSAGVDRLDGGRGTDDCADLDQARPFARCEP